MRKDLGEYQKAQDPDLSYYYNVNSGRFDNLHELPTFDEPANNESKKNKRARRRVLPGLGASEVRSSLPAAGTSSIRRNFHTDIEQLAI